MRTPRRVSPYLGGPRARWPQVFLLLLHVALLVAIVWMALLFSSLQNRYYFEPWQKVVFWGLVVVCLLGFAWRTFLIAQDLVAAFRKQGRPPDATD